MKAIEHYQAHAYCFLYKGWRLHRVHRNEGGYPACGTKVDMMAIEYTDDRPFRNDRCQKCFPGGTDPRKKRP